ncbi:MAG: guanosine-3',5'-bis(diphosphate) 3'-pyrophosphohydrolase [Polaribacter sp.]|jgi:guanosine-3',5'-bis(diphosphate) 3'-pyrophosphohydrolase
MQEAQYSPEEETAIQEAYLDMIDAVKVKINKTDKAQIKKAFEMAKAKHIEQRRKSGEPYIFHPIAVAKICGQEIGLGATALVSALLHDVVEDTDTTLADIEVLFSPKIRRIVDGLTKLEGMYQAVSPQAENFKKVLSTLASDVRIILIKMADRLHNMRTLNAMPRHKQVKIAAETSLIYAPLAHRLGLYNIKTEYQDLCMKITEPDTYQDIAKKLQETRRDRENYIQEFIKPLTSSLDLIRCKYRITGRPKSIYSINNKIYTKGVPFEEIYDLFAIRIIVDVPPKKEKPICWQIYSIVTDVHQPIPERLKDWITTPKANGYESLHTTVIGPAGRFVEVQIRSERMDDIAERGFAAHWKYKENTPQPDVFDNWLDSVRELIENPDSDAVEFVDDFSANLYSEGVYVFTPKGDLMILPNNATALDFAFAIHSDVGYHCKSVKVNKKLEPLGYKLKNGDQLTVVTDKNQKPTEAWLKMVVTGKARSKIRSAMKEARRKEGGVGREELERKLKNRKLDIEANVDLLVNHFGMTSRVDLYYEIAMSTINITEELKKFTTDGTTLVKPVKEVILTHKVKTDEVGIPKAASNQEARLRVEGEQADQYGYTLANCCNPVQGDDVFAYLTVSSGLKIHRTNCPNATNLAAKYGYRIMKAEWVSTSSTAFIAELLITGIDDGIGVIERLSRNISYDLGLNMRSFNIESEEGKFKSYIKLFILNKDQLNFSIKGLKNLPGVTNVTRVN